MINCYEFPAIHLCASLKQLLQIQANLTAAGVLSHHSGTTFFHNSLIRAAVRFSSPCHSLLLFRQLLRSGLLPDHLTFPSMLSACSLAAVRPLGFSAHAATFKLGLDSDVFVHNTLIRFYSCVGLIFDARRVFDRGKVRDVVSYNTIMTGYARVGDLHIAREMFDEMPERSSISWSAMISGYVQAGRSKEGIDLFLRMQSEGFDPGDATSVSVLVACAQLGALELGKWVHRYLRSKGAKLNLFVGTSLVDMYAKCGEMDSGMQVFREMEEKNLLAWTTAIKGLAMHGRGLEALQLFEDMEVSGIIPDDIAFIGAICACTHAGMVNHGRLIFKSMTEVYGIKPKIEHYGCLVDLLARNGFLHEARELVESMPMAPDASVWGALMAGCRFHGDADLAEDVIKHLVILEPDNSGVYVLLANIYSASGRHSDARKVWNLMERKGVEKSPGYSLIEIGGTIHQFVAGDRSHPQIKYIQLKWEEIEGRLRSEGYIPDREDMLLDID